MARDITKPVTKAQLRADWNALQVKIQDLRAEQRHLEHQLGVTQDQLLTTQFVLGTVCHNELHFEVDA